jgi:hypothetical protein
MPWAWLSLSVTSDLIDIDCFGSKFEKHCCRFVNGLPEMPGL